MTDTAIGAVQILNTRDLEYHIMEQQANQLEHIAPAANNMQANKLGGHIGEQKLVAHKAKSKEAETEAEDHHVTAGGAQHSTEAPDGGHGDPQVEPPVVLQAELRAEQQIAPQAEPQTELQAELRAEQQIAPQVEP